MKINFCKTDADRILNYMNIHPYGNASPNNDVFHLNFDNFDDLCCDGEAIEIRVNDSLAYIKSEHHQGLVNYWAKKLAHSGTISFVGPDTLIVARSVTFNQLTTREYNELVMNGKQSAVSMPYLIELLKNAGLHIKERRIDNFNYIIIGERP